MKFITNECCDCASPGYPCLGDSCPYAHMIHYRCDRCGAEITDEDDLYNDGESDLCLDCLKETFKKKWNDDPNDPD